jgi:hypothetical protein
MEHIIAFGGLINDYKVSALFIKEKMPRSVWRISRIKQSSFAHVNNINLFKYHRDTHENFWKFVIFSSSLILQILHKVLYSILLVSMIPCQVC